MAQPLPDPAEWEYIKVRKSGVHGRGLFAARDLPKGTRVMRYLGEKVSKGEGTRRTEEQWNAGRMYMFNLNKRTDLDGSPDWNLARLANYSCDPNCESQNDRGRTIWIVARRDIAKGDEITYDYNFDFVDPPPVCHCRSGRCRGYIVGSGGLRQLRAWLRRHDLPVPPGLAPRRPKAQRKKVGTAASRPTAQRKKAASPSPRATRGTTRRKTAKAGPGER